MREARRAGWEGTSAELRSTPDWKIKDDLERSRRAHGMSRDSPWWRSIVDSLPVVRRLLSDSSLDDVRLLLETILPITPWGELARTPLCLDALLVGGSMKDMRYTILELKQWTNLRLSPHDHATVVFGDYKTMSDLHPRLQVMRQLDALRLMHEGNDRATAFRGGGLVFLYNEPGPSRIGTFEDIPIYTRDDESALIEALQHTLLPSSLKGYEHRHLIYPPGYSLRDT